MLLVLPAFAQEPPPMVNGTPTDQYPQVVLLLHSRPDGYGYVCSGTLVAPDWVLTAGHCVVDPLDEGLTEMSVFVGSDWFEGLDETLADDWFANPHYAFPEGGPAQSDLGLVHLEAPLPYDPIPLQSEAVNLIGEELRWVGWGASGPAMDDAGLVKRYGDMTVADYDDEFILGYDEGGVSICGGDSGGPALLLTGGTPLLVGVTSFHTPHDDTSCDGTGDVSGSSQVRLYTDWIESYTGLVQAGETDDEPDWDPQACRCGGGGAPGGLGLLLALGIVRRR